MIKVLAVSDQAIERIYTLAENGHFKDVDLILGCGDLPYTYLEYLLSIMNVPLCYVPGNHDPEYNAFRAVSYAEGASNLDLRTALVKGMFLSGFGGSIRYRPDGINQYTQEQAYMRAFTLLARLLVKRAFYGRAPDILISHSPPFRIHDEEEPAHEGLKALNFLIHAIRPRYLFHGHTHFFRHNLEESVTQVGRTTVMNVFPYKVIEINDV